MKEKEKMILVSIVALVVIVGSLVFSFMKGYSGGTYKGFATLLPQKVDATMILADAAVLLVLVGIVYVFYRWKS